MGISAGDFFFRGLCFILTELGGSFSERVSNSYA